MKSEVLEDRYIVECDCSSPDHIMMFDFDSELKMIDIYFSGNWRDSFFKRLKYACKFLFFKKSFVWGDSIVITNRNAQQIQEILDKVKNK